MTRKLLTALVAATALTAVAADAQNTRKRGVASGQEARERATTRDLNSQQLAGVGAGAASGGSMTPSDTSASGMTSGAGSTGMAPGSTDMSSGAGSSSAVPGEPSTGSTAGPGGSDPMATPNTMTTTPMTETPTDSTVPPR